VADRTAIQNAVLTDLSLNALNKFSAVQIASGGSINSSSRSATGVACTSGVTYTVRHRYIAGTSGKLRFLAGRANRQMIVVGTIGSLFVGATTGGTVTIISDESCTTKGTGERCLTFQMTPNYTGTMSFRFGPNSSIAGETVIELGTEVIEGATTYFSPLCVNGGFSKAADLMYDEALTLYLSNGFTVAFDGIVNGVVGSFDRLYHLEDLAGGTANRILSFRDAGSANVAQRVFETNVSQAAFTTAYTLGDQIKEAMRIETDNINAAFNGTAGTNDTSCAYVAPDRVYVGASNTSTGAMPISMLIRSLNIITNPKPDSYLEAVTS
jgi:hypothetical protein